jgi:hypothetical protein
MPLARRLLFAARPDSSAARFGEMPSVKCRSTSFRQGLLTSIVELRCAEIARALSYPQLLSLASNCEAVRVSPHYRISSSSLFLSDNPARPALPQLPPRVRRAAGLKLAPERRTVRTQPPTLSAHQLGSRARLTKPLVLCSRSDVFALGALVQDLTHPKIVAYRTLVSHRHRAFVALRA